MYIQACCQLTDLHYTNQNYVGVWRITRLTVGKIQTSHVMLRRSRMTKTSADNTQNHGEGSPPFLKHHQDAAVVSSMDSM